MTPNEPPLTQLGRALTEVDDLKTTVGELTHVLNTERATTRRFRLNMAGLVVLLLLNLGGVSFAYRAADDAKVVSETLSDCLIPKGDCFNRLAQQGLQGSVRTLRFQYCVLRNDPAVRTDDLMDGCVVRAFPDVANIVELVRGD